MAKDPFDLGTWEVFEKNLKDAFEPYDAPGDALEEMKTLRMGNGLIEEHNARFKMIVTKSRLDKTSPAVIDYYRETLNVPLQRQTHIKPSRNGVTGLPNSTKIGGDATNPGMISRS